MAKKAGLGDYKEGNRIWLFTLYFCHVKDEQERKRLLPYVIAIIVIGGVIIIALVDWLFSL